MERKKKNQLRLFMERIDLKKRKDENHDIFFLIFTYLANKQERTIPTNANPSHNVSISFT